MNRKEREAIADSIIGYMRANGSRSLGIDWLLKMTDEELLTMLDKLEFKELLKKFVQDSEIHYSYIIKKDLQIWYNSLKDIFYIGYQMGLERTEIPHEAVKIWINNLEEDPNERIY